MNSTNFARKTPKPFGTLIGLASPASPRPAPRFTVLQGMSAQAGYLDAVVYDFSTPPTAAQLGWQVPTTARIEVKLAGVQDADWALEPDEMSF